jgi:hypothetical protein
MRTKIVWRWFFAFAFLHLALFAMLPLTLGTFEARTAWFSVNLIPWYPLERLGVLVTTYGWLTLPNEIGWVWCIFVWTALYGSLSVAAERFSRLRGSGGSGDA